MKKVLVTGANGYLGKQLVTTLAQGDVWQVFATDLREPDPSEQLPGVSYFAADIRESQIADFVAAQKPDVVVHLAAVIAQGALSDQDVYDIDVGGTRSLLDACSRNGVQRFVVTSSGAAYGYYPDNSEWLTEDDPIRGNDVFLYARHKRIVEEMLAEYREKHPALEQVILRVGTIIGADTKNKITDMFDGPRLLSIRGYPSPFVFIWDQDLVMILERALQDGPAGIYNVAGDGALAPAEIAEILKKPLLQMPLWFIRGALALLHPLKLSQYGPEQVLFLQYRPVLDNRRLKEDFGYTPHCTSREAFMKFVEGRSR